MRELQCRYKGCERRGAACEGFDIYVCGGCRAKMYRTLMEVAALRQRHANN